MTAELRSVLGEIETLLRAGCTVRATHPAPETTQALADAMERLERLLEGGARVSPDMARRVAHVRAQFALQTRTVPAGTLDGLYEDVRAETAGGGIARAGMSGAFLDAPRVLARWRLAASAACLLLAASAVYLVQGAASPGQGGHGVDGPRPLADPRDELLTRWDPAVAAERPGTASDHASDPVPAGFEVGHASTGGQPVGHRGAAGVVEFGRPSSGTVPGRRTLSREGVPLPGSRARAERGFFVFHMSTGGETIRRGSIQVDETRLLDAFGIRLRLVPPRPLVPTERETN